MIRVLLLGAGGSAGANVVDALRRSEARYHIVGVDISPIRLHLSTADERCLGLRAGAEGYLDALQQLSDRFGIDVVHPQPDPDVMAVGRARDALRARTFLPVQSALDTVADKAAFAAAMSRAGVAVPETLPFTKPDDVGELTAYLLERHERVWVRARVGAGARASLPVRSADQAVAWIRWWCEERDMAAADFMAAEMLPGREFAYQSVWQDGELVAGQARERVEYLYGFLTPHGQTSTPAVARTVKDRRIDDLAQTAICALDPRPQGAYCVDIKEAGDSTPRVTEINAGRFFTTSNFFAHAGLNMPDMLIQCAVGQRPPRRGSSPLPPDLYWVRMVDMGYVLVPGDQVDNWPRNNR